MAEALCRSCVFLRGPLLAPLVKEADIVVDGGEQNLAVASFYGQTKGRARHWIDLELADKLTFRREFHDFTVVARIGGIDGVTISSDQIAVGSQCQSQRAMQVLVILINQAAIALVFVGMSGS